MWTLRYAGGISLNGHDHRTRLSSNQNGHDHRRTLHKMDMITDVPYTIVVIYPTLHTVHLGYLRHMQNFARRAGKRGDSRGAAGAFFDSTLGL